MSHTNTFHIAKRLAIASVAIVMSIGVANADTSVYLGGWSKHTSASRANNNTQNAVILNHNNYLVGHYQNSFYGNSTWLVGYEYRIKSLSTDLIDVSISPMLTKGYRICPGRDYEEYAAGTPGRVCPIATLAVKYTEYRVQPALVVSMNVATFMLHIKF